MTTSLPARTTSKAMLWTGRVISAIPVLMMGGMGTFIFFFKPEMVAEPMNKYGYPAGVGRPLLMVEVACVIVYLIPRTNVLGAVLLTGYLGGAVSTHVRAGEPFWMPVVFAMFVWLGLVLRDAKVRALLPIRH